VRVDHVIFSYLPRQVDFLLRAVLFHRPRQVDTGTAENAGRHAVDAARGDRRGFAGVRAQRVVQAETEEPVERVVVAVEAVPDRSGQLRCQVVAQVTEHRIVAIDADLIRQPEGVRPAGDGLRHGQLEIGRAHV